MRKRMLSKQPFFLTKASTSFAPQIAMLKILELLENRTLLGADSQDAISGDNEISFTEAAWDTAETAWDIFIQKIAHPLTNGWIGINAANLIFNTVTIAAEFKFTQSATPGNSPLFNLAHNPFFKTAGMGTFFALPLIHLASHSNNLAKAIQQQEAAPEDTTSADLILGSENASFYESLVTIDHAGILGNAAKVILTYLPYFKRLPETQQNTFRQISTFYMTGLAAYTLNAIWDGHVQNREIRNTAHATTLSLIENNTDIGTPWEGLSQDTFERLDTTRYTFESYSAGARLSTSLAVTSLELFSLTEMGDIWTKSLSLYTVQLPGIAANALRLNINFFWDMERSFIGGYPDAETWPDNKAEALLLRYKAEQAAHTLPYNTSSEAPQLPATQWLEAYVTGGNLSAEDLAALREDTPENGIKLLKVRLGIS